MSQFSSYVIHCTGDVTMLYTQQGFGVICDMQDGWETITFLGQEQQNLQTLPKRPKKKGGPCWFKSCHFQCSVSKWYSWFLENVICKTGVCLLTRSLIQAWEPFKHGNCLSKQQLKTLKNRGERQAGIVCRNHNAGGVHREYALESLGWLPHFQLMALQKTSFPVSWPCCSTLLLPKSEHPQHIVS